MVCGLFYTERLYQKLGDKPVSAIMGMDAEVADLFAQTPFCKAYLLLDVFASNYTHDIERFTMWLDSLFDISKQQISDCFLVLSVWCRVHLKN